MMKIFTTTLFLLVYQIGIAQFIDKYGINIGANYSTQLWNYKVVSIDRDLEYKLGYSVSIFAEKNLNNWLSIKPEFGYIQKGFSEEFIFTDVFGNEVNTRNDKITFNDLTLNIGFKFSPFENSWKPYSIIGIGVDYMFSYKDAIYIEPASGNNYGMYESVIDTFNKANICGLLGFGIEFNDIVYIEVDYNPSLTKSLNSESLETSDKCLLIKLGLNINKLLNK